MQNGTFSVVVVGVVAVLAVVAVAVVVAVVVVVSFLLAWWESQKEKDH
jgi:phage-related minor tail protein